MKFTVLQWNAWYAEDIRHVAEFLRDHPADAICLQELTIDNPNQITDHCPRWLAKELGLNLYFKDLPIENTDGTKEIYANAVLSPHEFKNGLFTWINEPKAGGGYNDEFRAYVEATIMFKGTEVTVGTTHMSYTHRFEGTPAREVETGRLLDIITSKTGPYVFTGDLNAVPDSPTITGLEALLQPAGPTYAEPTWTTKPFSYNGFEAKTLDWRLDYIFASRQLRLVDSQIIHTDYSDHLPILATFEC